MSQLFARGAIFVAALSGVVLGVAYADHDHHGPPQQAIDACKSKTDGAACTVTFGDKTVNGTCKAGHRDASVLVCHPPHPPGPPPEAINACNGKAPDDACTVTFHDKSINGTCSDKGFDGNTVALHCRPPHGPHHQQ